MLQRCFFLEVRPETPSRLQIANEATLAATIQLPENYCGVAGVPPAGPLV